MVKNIRYIHINKDFFLMDKNQYALNKKLNNNQIIIKQSF